MEEMKLYTHEEILDRVIGVLRQIWWYFFYCE